MLVCACSTPSVSTTTSVFLAEEQAYGQVASAAQELLDGETPGNEAKQIPRQPAGRAGRAMPPPVSKRSPKLLDQHGTGRVLFRNSRANIQGFPSVISTSTMLLPDRYKTAIKVMGMMGGNGGDLQTRALLPLSRRSSSSSKATTPPGPSSTRASMVAGTAALCPSAEGAGDLLPKRPPPSRWKRRCAPVKDPRHRVPRRMSILERDKASAYFAQRMVAPGAALLRDRFRGRNFQFASHLVLFDLPLNPDLLEQRIGRLDRIGQQNIVGSTFPIWKGLPPSAPAALVSR